MNNADLDKLLKAAPVPERPADYWEDFPRQVLAALPRGSRRRTQPKAPSWRRLTLARLTFVVSAVTACLLIGFTLSSWRHRVPSLTAHELATVRTYLREMEGLFPNQVQAVVFEASGPRLVLAERADVASAQPVFVRVTGPGGPRGFLTFSGQQIRLNGELVDVLVTGRGQVLLVGASLAWSSADADAVAGPWRINARSLGVSS
ncbi:MAG: hypothetical protein MUF81_16610 [Verrucomicrobia bacterium]|jgi:hypothetical protein|nr:hypothetical protein [Verrucomicrobiota bacterium]